jgi:hypothetical protein
VTTIRVECYAGSRADERPRAIEIAGRRLAVREVLDGWYGEDHLYYKVRLEGGGVIRIRRDGDGHWTLERFDAEEEA